MIYDVTIDGTEHRLELKPCDGEVAWHASMGANLRWTPCWRSPTCCRFVMEGKAYEIRRERLESDLRIWVGDQAYAAKCAIRDRCAAARDAQRTARGTKTGCAHAGESREGAGRRRPAVEAGQGIMVVEAMKMQNEIKSPKNGIVVKLAVAEGAAVNAGDVLAIVE